MKMQNSCGGERGVWVGGWGLPRGKVWGQKWSSEFRMRCWGYRGAGQPAWGAGVAFLTVKFKHRRVVSLGVHDSSSSSKWLTHPCTPAQSSFSDYTKLRDTDLQCLKLAFANIPWSLAQVSCARANSRSCGWTTHMPRQEPESKWSLFSTP